MRKTWQMIVTLILATAISASGFAGSGNGNGGGKSGKPKKEKPVKQKKPKKEKKPKADKPQKVKKPKKQDAGTSTSFVINEVLVTDSRILDLTGTYFFQSPIVPEEVTLLAPSTTTSLVQDNRGKLVGISQVVLPDGMLVETNMMGGLQLTGQQNLSVRLEGSSSDGLTNVNYDGNWDGTAFQTVVSIDNNGVVSTFDTEIIPANPMRGFIIEPGTSSNVTGNKLWENRNVVLPWGNEVIRSQHMNKKGFKFMMHASDFGIDLRGTVDSLGVISLSRAKLHLGYGSLWLDPETVSVLPAI